MDATKRLAKVTTNEFFPLRVVGTSMLPNILLMCKLAFVMLCLYGFVGYINDPHIPFLKLFDQLRAYQNVFKLIMRLVFLLSGVLLLLNVRVRSMSILLGITIILILLSSKPVFRNHLFILGCFFFLAGLSNKKHDPWLLYVQFALVYIGAVINKIPQIDWWTGQFMDNWLGNARENHIYISIAKFFPEMVFAKFLSWSSMLSELTIAILILNKKTHKLAVWGILIFHTLLYTLTAHRFGHFYEDIVLGLLLFLNWPKHSLKIFIDNQKLDFFSKAVQFLNFNKSFIWHDEPFNQVYWLKITINGKAENNWNGLRRLLLYSSNFYVFLFGLDFLIRLLFNGISAHIVLIVITWMGLLFFLPLLWNTKRRIEKEIIV